jgi:hypothetical protein
MPLVFLYAFGFPGCNLVSPGPDEASADAPLKNRVRGFR